MLAARCSLLVTTVWLLAARCELSTAQLLCQEDVASQCLNNAVTSAQPSGCNWNIIMPVLTTCINDAVVGCSTVTIDQWQALIDQFNQTLNAGMCSSSCPNPQASNTQIQLCYTVTSSGQTYVLSDVIANVLSSPSTSSGNCSMLQSAVSCLNKATSGCSALTDIAYQTLNTMNYAQAADVCELEPFNAATTLSPLAIFNTITTTPASMTTIDPGSNVLIGDGTNNKLETSWIVLIAAGSLLVIIIICVMAFIATKIVSDIKSNREEVLLMTDETAARTRSKGWRYITSKYITSSRKPEQTGWPGNQNPSGSNFIYRRDFID